MLLRLHITCSYLLSSNSSTYLQDIVLINKRRRWWWFRWWWSSTWMSVVSFSDIICIPLAWGLYPYTYTHSQHVWWVGIYFHIWNTGNLFNAKWNSLHALQPDEGDTLVPRSTFTSHHTSSATQPPVQVTSPTISVPPEESLFVRAGRRLVANFLVSSCDCCCQSITLGLIKYIAFCLDILGTCYTVDGGDGGRMKSIARCWGGVDGGRRAHVV